jgi:hypothetical protein
MQAKFGNRSFVRMELASGLPDSVLLSTSTKVLGVDGAAVAAAFGTSPNATYVAFGVGRYTTMQGKTIQEPPVVYDDNAKVSPSVAYGPLGVVFQVTDDTGTTPLDKAAFIGPVHFHETGIETGNDHLSEYYKIK